jgi:uncharacterized DUF497 family protein
VAEAEPFGELLLRQARRLAEACGVAADDGRRDSDVTVTIVPRGDVALFSAAGGGGRFYTILALYGAVFEYDPAKSEANREKHGIDFVEAQALWMDPYRLAIRSFSADDEERWLVIGKIGDRHWAAIHCFRDDAIRIISVRRARTNEVKDYDRR